MIDRANARFWECFAKLPREVQEAARQKHRVWLENPFHPSLHFKEVMPGLWSWRASTANIERWRGVGWMRFCGYGLGHMASMTG